MARSSVNVCLPDTVTAPQCTLAPATAGNIGCPPPTLDGSCPPFSLPVAWCPVQTPRQWWITPQVTIPGGQFGGYDPYGQSPFGG